MAIGLIDITKENACRTAEANAIRAKSGSSSTIAYDFDNGKGFAEAISAIPAGEGIGITATAENRNAVGEVTSVETETSMMPTYICTETTGGTTLTATIHANADSWILATVTTRSLTMFSSGWTLLHQSASLGEIGVNQRMAFLCRYVEESGDVSISVTQTSSGRIYINLIAFEGIQGFAYHEGSEAQSEEMVNIDTTAPKPYGNAVWGCSATDWSTGREFTSWKCDDLFPVCLYNTTQPRQANFIDFTEAENRHFSTSASVDSCYIIDCVEVIGGE